jgi:hypothetical protein
MPQLVDLGTITCTIKMPSSPNINPRLLLLFLHEASQPTNLTTRSQSPPRHFARSPSSWPRDCRASSSSRPLGGVRVRVSELSEFNRNMEVVLGRYSLLAKISLDMLANLLESWFRRSSTAALRSVRASSAAPPDVASLVLPLFFEAILGVGRYTVWMSPVDDDDDDDE